MTSIALQPIASPIAAADFVPGIQAGKGWRKFLLSDIAAFCAVGGVAGVANFNGRTGAVSLTSGDVTGVLGFTPEPAIAAGTASQYWRGDKSWQTLNKAAVGLGNVDNTSDASKPVSTAQQAALNLKLDASAVGYFAFGTDAANLSGTIAAGRMPAYTGDATSPLGSVALTLATVNSNTGAFGSATAIPVITLDGKGRVTAASAAANTGGWTETTLTADSATTLATFADISDGTRIFSFTPPANGNYEMQAVLLIQTATATVLPRLGVHVLAQGAGSYGAAQIDQTGATVTSRVNQDGTWTTAAVDIQVPAGGVAAAGTPYMAYVTIRGRSGASPAAISLQLASETAGTSVRVLAGSQMRTKVS